MKALQDMTEAEKYLGMVDDFDTVVEWVDCLSYAERIQLRGELERLGCDKLVRNLYYDYDKQCWIE